MDVRAFDAYLRSTLDFDSFEGVDPAINGLQVGAPGTKLSRAAFAVDACLETIKRAVDWGADLLFVHHGIFWGAVEPLTGAHYRRVKLMAERDLALYAVHLPLDHDLKHGNNAVMARELDLTDVEPFGAMRGRSIGVMGRMTEPSKTERITAKLFGAPENVIQTLPFGPEQTERVALVSGGGAFALQEAIDAQVDLLITGDAKHTVYHQALESDISVVFGGHYATETWGPEAIRQLVSTELGLETTFLHVPTGL